MDIKKVLLIIGALCLLIGWYVSHNDLDIAFQIFGCDNGSHNGSVCLEMPQQEVKLVSLFGSLVFIGGIVLLILGYLRKASSIPPPSKAS
jgi:hypothetical protein